MKALNMPELTEEQQSELVNGYRHTKDVRIRTRAQLVLLACEQHLSAPSIAVIVREDAETGRRWLKRYRQEGSEGLFDRPRTGAPSKTTQAYKERLLAAVRRRPRSLGQPYFMWTLQCLADYLAEQMGITISAETVRRLLASHEIVLADLNTLLGVLILIMWPKRRRLKRCETESNREMSSLPRMSSTSASCQLCAR